MTSLSDEESFVILGTSPMPSLDVDVSAKPELEIDSPGGSCFSSLQRSQLRTTNTPGNGGGGDNASAQNSLIESMNNTSSSDGGTGGVNGVSVKKAADAVQVIQAEMAEPILIKNSINVDKSVSYTNSKSLEQKSIPPAGAAALNGSTGSGIGSRDSSLAASFILGEINADVLKTSVYSQFPSLCSMEACAEDVVKLQNFMSEYIELKNTLSKVNLTMRQFYNKTQQWKDDMQRVEQEYKEQLLDCQTQMATLRNQNLELTRNVNTKIEQIAICDELRQREHDLLMQSNSEKSAQIENMRVQIERLEQQQLSSFEYVPKNENDSKEKPDYVDRLEHTRMVKDFQRQLSVLLAENLELKDMQKQYIDEINCLKVNLVASEELINQLRADINLLKAKDMEKSMSFTSFETERNQIREEMTLLRQQVEIFSKDFEMERVARQNLAGEKDQLLQDLRSLQRKNQELIEEAQKQWLNSDKGFVKSGSPSYIAAAASAVPSEQRPIRTLPPASSVASHSPSSPSSNVPMSSSPSGNRCPICSKTFKSLSVLQSHVNDCLDRN